MNNGSMWHWRAWTSSSRGSRRTTTLLTCRRGWCIHFALFMSRFVFVPFSKEFGTLRALGAKEWIPYMDDVYEDSDTWEVLRERWSLQAPTASAA